MPEIESRHTPLYDEHLRSGGRLVPFAGYMMPVQYTSIVDEHRNVRTRAGLFDVSHMGEVFIRGERALDFVQLISCNDHSKMVDGRAQYTGLMYPQGTFVDDMLVHRMAENEYLLVVNAANRHKDVTYLQNLATDFDGAEVEDASDAWAQLAIQGPESLGILAPLVTVDLEALRYYRFTHGEVAGAQAIIARTGYTGEDGFELYLAPSAAPVVWRELLAAGSDAGLAPTGLGARDTLRLEAGMCLYGNDIDETTTPLEAGLGWIVKLGKGDFIGRDVLERQAEEGVERRLVGFEMVDRGVARHGYPVHLEPEGEPCGVVTSGTHLPTVDHAAGMAYVPAEAADSGREIIISIRDRRARARIVDLPFYSRTRSK